MKKYKVLWWECLLEEASYSDGKVEMLSKIQRKWANENTGIFKIKVKTKQKLFKKGDLVLVCYLAQYEITACIM